MEHIQTKSILLDLEKDLMKTIDYLLSIGVKPNIENDIESKILTDLLHLHYNHIIKQCYVFKVLQVDRKTQEETYIEIPDNYKLCYNAWFNTSGYGYYDSTGYKYNTCIKEIERYFNVYINDPLQDRILDRFNFNDASE